MLAASVFICGALIFGIMTIASSWRDHEACHPVSQVDLESPNRPAPHTPAAKSSEDFT